MMMVTVLDALLYGAMLIFCVMGVWVHGRRDVILK